VSAGAPRSLRIRSRRGPRLALARMAATNEAGPPPTGAATAGSATDQPPLRRPMASGPADARDHHAPPESIDDLLLASSTRMNRAVDGMVANLPNASPWVADPGKIWILHRRIWDGSSSGAVNYGWHVEPTSKPLPFPVSHNAAIPGLWVIQDAGGRHDAYHEDYSQLCMLVAPWCMVAWVGHDEKQPMRTADVYHPSPLQAQQLLALFAPTRASSSRGSTSSPRRAGTGSTPRKSSPRVTSATSSRALARSRSTGRSATPSATGRARTRTCAAWTLAIRSPTPRCCARSSSR
jgi:hypothetical protein